MLFFKECVLHTVSNKDCPTVRMYVTVVRTVHHEDVC